MKVFTVIDFLGDEWIFIKHRFVQQPNGYWTLWAWVVKGPKALKNYQELPFPVFTEWFE